MRRSVRTAKLTSPPRCATYCRAAATSGRQSGGGDAPAAKPEPAAQMDAASARIAAKDLTSLPRCFGVTHPLGWSAQEQVGRARMLEGEHGATGQGATSPIELGRSTALEAFVPRR